MLSVEQANASGDEEAPLAAAATSAGRRSPPVSSVSSAFFWTNTIASFVWFFCLTTGAMGLVPFSFVGEEFAPWSVGLLAFGLPLCLSAFLFVLYLPCSQPDAPTSFRPYICGLAPPWLVLHLAVLVHGMLLVARSEYHYGLPPGARFDVVLAVVFTWIAMWMSVVSITVHGAICCQLWGLCLPCPPHNVNELVR